MCPHGSSSMEDPQHIIPDENPRLWQPPTTTEGSRGAGPAPLRPTNRKKIASYNQADREEDCCRHCGSRSLRVDWAQGDKVCTNCGVVAEERMCDDRPEWREFNDADDLAKGLPAAARCGLVAVDESRYLGGLQPTSLSRVPFGGTGTGPTVSKVARLRQRLVVTNHKLDHMMGIRHKRALKDARVSRMIRKRQLEQNPGLVETDQSDMESVVGGSSCDIRPELEQILIQEEEEVNRMQAALNADKWSLRRAILLHGLGEEQPFDGTNNIASERDDLSKRLDSKLRKASADLYKAYCMVQEASRRLDLPDRVTNEATTMLCRYAARRDGFTVKGVSSRLSSKTNRSVLSEQKQNEVADTLREHNKLKQMGSLAAALLLLTARNLGWARPLAEVCGSIQQPSQSMRSSATEPLIKAKHCSRAMDEIKSAFPDYARSVAATPAAPVTTSSIHVSRIDDVTSTSNFVDHSVRKLWLPPVAEASIRTLVWQCRREQIATGQNSGTKLSTLSASLTYFMCLAGSVMQRLAEQAQRSESSRSNTNAIGMTQKKKALLGRTAKTEMEPPPSKKPKIAIDSPRDEKQANMFNDNEEEEEPFDVFSHIISSEELSQKREYEMRRVWDTWSEQTTWFRTVGDVEQSSGVSCNVILDHYKSSIYPRRQALLEMLRDAVTEPPQQKQEATSAPQPPSNILSDTPLAPILLSHVAVAAPLLSKKGKSDP